MGRIVTREELLNDVATWRAEDKTIVLTNGCFDLLHVGHIRYLAMARSLGDVLIVAVNDDASVRALKGPGRPLIPAPERAEVVAALASVDRVVIFSEMTAEDLVAAVRPDIYVKGGDYAQPGQDGKQPPEARIVAQYGGRVVIIPLVPGHSTSILLTRLHLLSDA
jgi:rfaE bifunctional protein nucleotidyltransferase chain/domain